MFIHFFCLCPLGLVTKLNFNISKEAYCKHNANCLNFYFYTVSCRTKKLGTLELISFKNINKTVTDSAFCSILWKLIKVKKSTRETTVALLKKRMNSLSVAAAGERLYRLCNLNTGRHFSLIRMPTSCLVLSFIKQLC